MDHPRLLLRCALLLGAFLIPAAAAIPIPIATEGSPALVAIPSEDGRPRAWSIIDWSGRELLAGGAFSDGGGPAAIEADLPAGWYGIRSGAARAGFMVIAADEGGRGDPFFAFDCALSWLELDRGRREALLGLLARAGFVLARERIAWASLEPGRGRFAAAEHDALRRAYAGRGIGVLEVFHDRPEWCAPASGRYPGDLMAAKRSWAAIAARNPTAALEVWNEPDLPAFAGLEGAPDHLVALTRAVAAGVRTASPSTLIGGGVLTKDASAALRTACWDMGLAGDCDFISFHDYQPPHRFEPWFTELRRELAEHGEPSMPLWVSESGAARGPVEDEEQEGSLAAQVVARAIEARACGAQRHVAFCLPWFPEDPARTWGACARDGSPLRLFAAYAHCARRLAGCDYIGDLGLAGAGRVRCFSGRGRVIAAAWGCREGRVAAGLGIRRAWGLDGRRLAGGEDGWPHDQGVVFLELPPAVAERIDRAAPTLALYRQAAGGRLRPPPRLLALQVADGGDLTPAPGGYRATGEDAVRVAIRATNLGAERRSLGLVLVPPSGGGGRPAQRLELAPEASALAWWSVPPEDGRWLVRTEDGEPPLVFTMARELDGEAVLAGLAAHRRRELAPTDLAADVGNRSERAQVEVRRTVGGAVLAGRAAEAWWCFPRVALPEDFPCDAILVRARCVGGDAAVRIMAFRGASGNVGYASPEPVLPSDGRWHWSLVRLADLVHCGYSDEDPDGGLVLARLGRISLGMSAPPGPATLEIGRLVLLRLGGLP